jgi:hypothetical protein
MEFEGTLVNRNNRAKEQVLYKVIAEKEGIITALNAKIKAQDDIATAMITEISELTTQIRALKSKEYRRSVRRKKQKVGEVGE